jgi:hypothetical protein
VITSHTDFCQHCENEHPSDDLIHISTIAGKSKDSYVLCPTCYQMFRSLWRIASMRATERRVLEIPSWSEDRALIFIEWLIRHLLHAANKILSGKP